MIRIIFDHIILLLALVFLRNDIVKAGDSNLEIFQIDFEKMIKNTKLPPPADNAVSKEENKKPAEKIEKLDFSEGRPSNQLTLRGESHYL